ncbi:MAG TPA: hypothetical protein VK806_03800 [Bacteroidia bacterium]|jgi:hypothetical protein|nr:hypothetical protein [Bacteroidia bacterium]
MKKVVVFIVIISFCSCSAQSPTKEEAKNAFLEIMKTLMKKDCDKFFSYFNDSIKILIPMLPSSRVRQYKPSDLDTILLSGPILKEISEMCGKIKEDFRGNPDTLYTNYINQVDIKVLNEKEFLDTAALRAKDKKWYMDLKDNGFYLRLMGYMPKYYTANDFLVFGNMTKDGDYIKPMGRFGWYVYVLRKTKSGWKIFALTN